MWFMSSKAEDTFNNWAAQNVAVFEGCDFECPPEAVEHKVEYKDAHSKYTDMVEQELKVLLDEAEVDQLEFIEALEDQIENGTGEY